MPKVKWAENLKAAKKAPVKRDHIIELFEAYRKERHISRELLADRLGITPTTVSVKKTKGSPGYTVAEFKSWVKALNIPEEEAANAVFRYLMQE